MTARATTRTPARRTGTVRRETVLRLVTPADPPPPGKPLFEIDDRVFTMPDPVPAGTAIGLLVLLRGQEEDVGGVTLIRELCGNDAIEALLAHPGLTVADWRALVRTARDHALGPLEATPGN